VREAPGRPPPMRCFVSIRFPEETMARIWKDAKRDRSHNASLVVRRIVMDYYEAHPDAAAEPAERTA
jgi:hypothetical protein